MLIPYRVAGEAMTREYREKEAEGVSMGVEKSSQRTLKGQLQDRGKIRVPQRFGRKAFLEDGHTQQ